MIYKIFLYAHIVTGFIGLFSGVIVMINKKGDKRHKQIGKIFFLGMLLASVFALVLSVLKTNYFLFMIGIFTAYMVLKGRRYLSLRNKNDLKWHDYALSVIMAIFGTGLIGLGAQKIISEDNYGGIVFIVFGFISLMMVLQDYLFSKDRTKYKNIGLLNHIRLMGGAFVASLTAFMVVNIHFLPDILVWLLPSFIVSPLLSRWVRQNAKLKKSTN